MNKFVVERINAILLDLLEKGQIPWRQTWRVGHSKNLVTGRYYRGINAWTLGESEYWLTLKQCNDIGGRVNKGAKSKPAIFIAFVDKEIDAKTGEERILPKKRFISGYWNVFKVEDCTIPEDVLAKYKKIEPAPSVFPELDNIVWDYLTRPEKTGPRIEIKMGLNPNYIPALDRVEVPPIEAFTQSEEYYAAILHELCHSTGSKNRLKREGIVEFDRKGIGKYAKEELIAEIGSTYLMAHAGKEMPMIENAAAYIAGWKQAIHDDPNVVINASREAEKASQYVLGGI
jgi:antirestriction protein ArdC